MTYPTFHHSRSLAIIFGLAASLLPASLTAATYVGSETCKICHPAQYAQVTNSIHSKMIRTGAHLPGVIHGDLRKPNAPKLPVADSPTNDVHWVMGGHYKEESYIRTNWTGSNIAYRVTEFEWNPITSTYSNTKDKTRDWLVKCAGCHTTGYDPTTRTFSELNIKCEHCHGPASDHVANFLNPAYNPVIDRSAEGCGHCHIRAESVAMGSFTNKEFNFPIGYVLGQSNTLQFIPESLGIAASFFPDGTANRHREQYLDMHYPGRTPSKHYSAGVTCTKCHNPHTSGTITTYANGFPTNVYGIKIYDNVNNTTNYLAWDGSGLWNPTNHLKTTNYAAITAEGLCQTCHTNVQPNHVHKFNALAAAAPVNCVDCHMPDVINIDQTNLRGALHPHRFTSMMPVNSIKYGPNSQPNSCTYRCHQNMGADKSARAKWADSIVTFKVAPLVAATHPYQLRLVGTPEYQYALEASADLKTWTTLTTNTAAALQNYAPRWGFEFADPTSGGTGYRFFRARQVYPAP